MVRGAMWGIIAVAVLPVYLKTASASVAPYALDANTLALWHFDETANPPTGYADAAGNSGRTLVPAGTAGSLTSVAGLFGNGVSGFAPQGNTDNRLLAPSGGFSALPNPATHTLEAWVKFVSPETLPQNQSLNTKQMVYRNAGSQVPLEFYFTNTSDKNSLLCVSVKQSGDSAFTTVTANLGSISENTWYHIAYSLEQVGGNLNVKIYFQSETSGVATPTPIASQTLSGFTYNTASYNVRVGESGQTGADPFTGIIDEMRLSNIARTTFSTFAVPETASLSVLSLAGVGILLSKRVR